MNPAIAGIPDIDRHASPLGEMECHSRQHVGHVRKIRRDHLRNAAVVGPGLQAGELDRTLLAPVRPPLWPRSRR